MSLWGAKRKGGDEMLSDRNDFLYLLEEIRRINAVLDGKVRGPQLEDGHIGTESDALIVERNRLLDKLLEVGEEYTDFYEHAPDLCVSVDASSACVRKCNQTLLKNLGYSREEVVGHPIFDLCHPDCLDDVKKTFQTFQTTGEVQDAELALKRKDGSKIEVSLNVSSLRDPQGKVLSSRSILRDITERKQMQAGLEVFSAAASHDLRAPLRTINGFVYYLLKDHAPHLPPEAREYLNLIQNSVKRMDQLIRDLLSFSHVTHQPLQKQPVDLTPLVRAALEELRPEQEGRRVEIMIGDLPVCQGDPILLKQVFINLLGNALKYSRSRELALIEVGFQNETSEGEPVFFVKDNGIGFDPKWAHQIFKAFKRLHTASEYEGTGVGLAIVQQAIEHHRGRVWAEAAVDTGATFFFTLGNRTPTRTEASDQ
jgi:PAS domain S-box-containing protein